MSTAYTKALGANLRAIRTRQGLSLAGVEELSRGRWKAVVVGSYERGDRSVTVQKLAELAQFYGIPTVDLLPGTETPAGAGPPMRDPVNDAFAAALTRLRTEQGLTRQALAARAGIDQTGLGKIEAGAGGTTLMTAGLIAEALGTTPAEMLAPSKPARELTAAMGEARDLRELVREICDELVSRKYPAAKVAPWLKRAGLPT